MKKRLITLLMLITMLVAAGVTSHAAGYEDLTMNLRQTLGFMDRGLYLEAITECNNAINWHHISPEDVEIFKTIKAEAQDKYNKLVEESSKYQYYYSPDWNMHFKSTIKEKPKNGADNVDLKNGITIYSVHKDEYMNWPVCDKAVSAEQVLSAFCNTYKEHAYENEEALSTDFEVLSLNNTSVGYFPAKQVTFRITHRYGRYGKDVNSYMFKGIAFEYGGWIYLMKCQEDFVYNWSDDFWLLMETVRKSVYF